MAENSRIDDLRKRYHENPRRFFAPLANEYRKAGFLDRAILLCQKHLAEQPDNMNGQVVFGQTLFEAGQLAEAREPFTAALGLDPENLIALRHLGDIARLEGDADTARGWYVKVLELDRRNSEVLDLLQEVGGDVAEPRSGPSGRPTAGAGLVSVAPTVGISGGDVDTMGMIDLDVPSPPSVPTPAPKMPAPPVKTVVIDAQKLADQDRQEVESSSAITVPVAAVAPPSPITVPVAAVTPPAPKPAKRASLLDIDFSELTDQPSAKPPTPAAPLLDAEAAEYGFAAMELVGGSSDEPIGLPEGDTTSSLVEPPVESVSMSSGEPTLAGDLELADFSAEVSPLAGLEASEFEPGDAAPLADLDVPDVALPEVSPLEGLDRVDVTVDEVAPVSGLEATMALSAEPMLLDAELDAIEVPSAEAPIREFASLELPSVDVESAPAAQPMATEMFADEDEAEIIEPPSASVRPRMTRADMASLPLLADFGLEDDDEVPATEPAPSVEPVAELEPSEPTEPAPRASQRTPTFVTETMAELYLKQGFRSEAISVYQQLIAQQPNDAGLRERLAALEAAASEVPEFEVPTDLTEPEPAAANAVLDDVSFGEVGLRVPVAVPPMVTPVATGPSAREFFAAFARRGASPNVVLEEDVPDHVEPEPTASEWPLDALFGAATDVRDLHAAETLAGIATFEGPDGGTHIDEVLNADSTPRRSVPRVSESLKFDQFFAAPASATPTPPSTPAADEPSDDDLDQFQDWLQGLKP